jgi:hypothetical protein
MMAPHAIKASATHDPDTPRVHETMHSEHQDQDEFQVTLQDNFFDASFKLN